MKEERDRLKHETVTRTKTPEDALEASGQRKKSRQKFDNDEPITEATPKSTHKNAFVGEAPTVDNSNNRFMGLQHGTAQALRNIMPDETPDRNAGVSATRFGMEIAASAVGITRDPKKKKAKSKLQHENEHRMTEKPESKESDGEHPDHNEPNQEESQETPQADGESVSDDSPASEDSTEAQSDGTASDNAESSPKPPPKDSSSPSSSDTETADDSSSDKPESKLQFSKEEKQIVKLEKRAVKYGNKLDKARDKLPTKKVEKKQLVFDEDKKKKVTKLTHDKELIPIEDAKWNQAKSQSLVSKVGGVASSLAVTKIHAKIHQAEHQNVGVNAAHKAELLAESGYRGAKQGVRSAYRFHKNRPYRRVAKLEQKAIKNKMRLDYKRTLRDNPKLKSNPLSRFMQKRVIKRKYAAELRAAKNAAHTGKKAMSITAKVGKLLIAFIRKNPVLIIKLGLAGLLLFLIMSLFTMCTALFSGSNALIGAVTYPAEAEDIDSASVLMTELETDLRAYINEIEENYPGFDEYNLNIDSIGHNPFELIAFLSAVFHDFTFADVETTIREIFDEMYTLTIEEETETRTRTETRVGIGSWVDIYGNTHTYTYFYEEEVEYEWRTLNVTLTAQSFLEVITPRMDEEQTQHFLILMQSHGARQFIGNPFNFDWLPFVTSHYGYRIHPISSDKQFHWGIDIGLPTGTEILATFDGVVVEVDYFPTGYGRVVVIENEDGVQARFAHCDTIIVTVGQEIERGQVIATVGNTGSSTGSHLHLEVAWDGRRFNPLFFVEFRP
jgi:murein DD-endopeptidase MepM/ murein hydrolase activator NlpD